MCHSRSTSLYVKTSKNEFQDSTLRAESDNEGQESHVQDIEETVPPFLVAVTADRVPVPESRAVSSCRYSLTLIPQIDPRRD